MRLVCNKRTHNLSQKKRGKKKKKKKMHDI